MVGSSRISRFTGSSRSLIIANREFDGTVILVSHDRDFLDGLATKVYEFGGGLVKEHLGGIYEFLQKKKIDSLNELQKGAGLSASPTASAKGNEPETVQPSENKLSYEAQKELNKKIRNSNARWRTVKLQ